MGHEKHTWWHLEIKHKSYYFKALKVSACASGHGQKKLGTPVPWVPTDGPLRVPSAQASACLLSTMMKHTFLRQVTHIIEVGGFERQFVLEGFRSSSCICLSFFFLFCFTSVFPSPPPALLTSDSSLSVRDNSRTSTP